MMQIVRWIIGVIVFLALLFAVDAERGAGQAPRSSIC